MSDYTAPQTEQQEEWRFNLPLLVIAVLGTIIAVPILVVTGAVKMMRV
jgi:hypothetical protein